MTDIITRLHTAVITEVNPIDELTYPTTLGMEAAAEIERLRGAAKLKRERTIVDLVHDLTHEIKKLNIDHPGLQITLPRKHWPAFERHLQQIQNDLSRIPTNNPHPIQEAYLFGVRIGPRD